MNQMMIKLGGAGGCVTVTLDKEYRVEFGVYRVDHLGESFYDLGGTVKVEGFPTVRVRYQGDERTINVNAMEWLGAPEVQGPVGEKVGEADAKLREDIGYGFGDFLCLAVEAWILREAQEVGLGYTVIDQVSWDWLIQDNVAQWPRPEAVE